MKLLQLIGDVIGSRTNTSAFKCPTPFSWGTRCSGGRQLRCYHFDCGSELLRLAVCPMLGAVGPTRRRTSSHSTLHASRSLLPAARAHDRGSRLFGSATLPGGRAGRRFERASLQYRTPLDDSVIEQFEHQAKSRQSNFISKVL